MSAELAVHVFKKLESGDLRVLLGIELGMGRYEHVPVNVIVRFSGLREGDVLFRLKRLQSLRLIRGWTGPYVGYVLNYAGYDCLAVNALVKGGFLEAFGKPLGVGKEADVYDALNPKGERIAVKFHRLGRISFRQTKRVRGYTVGRGRVSWLYQSRLAAEREYEALKTLYPHGVAVPEPIAQNRHVVVMGLIEGAELADYIDIPHPRVVLQDILKNIRKTYLEAGVIHADLSEFNVILKPDSNILIIDWPQFVGKDHPNAGDLLKRDVRNILRFFRRKSKVKIGLKEALAHVRGEKQG